MSNRGPLGSGRSFTRGHQVLRQRDSYLPTHYLEQHSYSPIVIQSLELPHKISKGAGGYADDLAFLKIKVEVNIAVGVGRVNKTFDHAARDRLRFSIVSEQAIHPEGSVYAAPALFRPI